MVVLVVGPALLFVCCCRSCKPTELSEQEDEKEGMWEKYFGGVEEVDKKKKGQRRVAWFLEYKFAPKLIKFRYIVWALFLIWYGIAIWLVVAKVKIHHPQTEYNLHTTQMGSPLQSTQIPII